MTENNRYTTTKRVTVVNVVTNFLLACFKVVVGYIGYSHALIADGIHSFADIITDGLVLFAAKAGGKNPDREHPYGHQRIETFGAMIISLILIFVAGSIAYDAIMHLMSGEAFQKPEISVLIVAVVSILANEYLFRYTLAEGKKVNSNLLITNAYHNRSDVYVSVIVLFSVIGAMLGWPWFDGIGAILIALFIFKMGIRMVWDSTQELMDRAVDDETLQKITDAINTVSGVRSIHQLRTRMHGSDVFVDLHILVDPFISVSEGHHIGEQVHLTLLKLDEVVDVTVHIDPEDDELAHPSVNLPNRDEILAMLNQCWKDLPGFQDVHKTTLHYLDGKLYIEVFMAKDVLRHNQDTALIKMYRDAVANQADIASVVIHFMPEVNHTRH